MNHMFRNNSPFILSLAAIGGLFTTIIFASKEMPKAAKKIEELEEESIYEPSVVEKAMAVIPLCWKTILSATGTTFCILFSNYISRKQQGVLFASALGATQMLEKFKKSLSDEELDKAESKMAQDDYDKQKPTENLAHKEEDELYYESYSDNWFYSNDANVMSAMYHFNRNFALGQDRCVLEFFDFLGLDIDEKERKKYEKLGFNATEFIEGGLMPWIDFNVVKKTLDNGVSYKEISFQWAPIFDYENYGYDDRELIAYSLQNK